MDSNNFTALEHKVVTMAHESDGNSQRDSEDSPAELPFAIDEAEIYTEAPAAEFRLGRGTIMCLVMNRMIGSGIFTNAGNMFRSTNSTGAALMLWLAGVLYATAGVIIYIEYGLSVPRWTVDGTKIAVPRSGGDMNYLSYVYRWPAYRKDTVQFATVFYGITFIFFGTMAGNAINCAINLLTASNPGQDAPNNAQVRGVAVSITFLALFAHAFSRRGGLALNNLFAIVKLGMLLLIIGVTLAYSSGSIGPSPNLESTPWAQQPLFDGQEFSRNATLLENLALPYSFGRASHDSHSYSDAFLDVIFTFSGFEQANYVLGEISQPHRKFPIALGLSASTVSVLFVAVNICYWTVVPQYIAAKPGQNVAEAFFTITLGSLRPDDPYLGKRIASAFIAVSALGNVIVMSYTATRVKQEIAKEGFLPWPKFFAPDYDMSIGRILNWIQRKSASRLEWLFRSKWFAPANYRERTPVGASILHIFSCFVLISATAGMQAINAFDLLTGMSAYLINGFFGSFLALGILWLRLFKGKQWRMKSTAVRPSVSISAAAIYLVLNAWAVIANWIPSHGSSRQSPLEWYLIPVLSWIVLGFGVLWYVGFLLVMRRKDKKTNTVLVIRKVPDVREDPPFSGIFVQEHETSYIDRLPKDEAERLELHEAINLDIRGGSDVDSMEHDEFVA
ncbi:uncharacterized protein PV09_00794 [Verruconis gallopava]|uniref:Amino acid permease/ SLC12A domain-containing protein n=1 Tax=Verruconis gallopava TaxID=253628 RepID=A0A0D2AQQ9_9PEZI|nr:uncharacterized protein PV09_00794 [Verruconis gallopava]KIW08870.1 hypothetical protein PV09_00794 [Verruconis gallopava]